MQLKTILEMILLLTNQQFLSLANFCCCFCCFIVLVQRMAKYLLRSLLLKLKWEHFLSLNYHGNYFISVLFLSGNNVFLLKITWSYNFLWLLFSKSTNWHFVVMFRFFCHGYVIIGPSPFLKTWIVSVAYTRSIGT